MFAQLPRKLTFTVICLALVAARVSIRSASELIRDRYFDGESILLRDATEDLERQAKAMQLMMDGYDRVAIEAGQAELALDSDKFQKAIQERASYLAGYIVALAKSKMLDDFGQDQAADALLRPYVVESK